MGLDAAKALGHFDRQNLQVELTRTPDSITAMKAVISGQTDVALIAFSTIVSAYAEGAPVKIVMTWQPALAQTLIGASQFKSVAELKGARIGISTQGSTDYLVAALTLQAAGIQPDQVVWTPAGSGASERLQTLVAGRIDAVAVSNEQLIGLDRFPNVRVIAPNAGRSLPLPSSALFATQEYIDKNQDAVQRLVEAMLLTTRDLQANNSSFAKAVDAVNPGQYTPEQLSSMAASFSSAGFSVNGGINPQRFQQWVDFYRTGVAPTQADNPRLRDASALVDTRFVAAALNKLGPTDAEWDRP
jgi:NitT/TauT family transport system substrate-binding protein